MNVVSRVQEGKKNHYTHRQKVQATGVRFGVFTVGASEESV